MYHTILVGLLTTQIFGGSLKFILEVILIWQAAVAARRHIVRFLHYLFLANAQPIPLC